MKYRFIIISFICALFLTSCSPQAKDKTYGQENASQTELEITHKIIQHAPKPKNEGVFIRNDATFKEIKAGSAELLKPTNAERGFGFEQPVGIPETSVLDLSIVTTTLNLSQLQLTAFKGISVNTDHWFDNVDNTNVAWIPERDVSMNLNVIEPESGFAEIHFNAALEPGFYILHDDSFLRSRRVEDVSAYYPVVVFNSDMKSLWETEADSCFKLFSDTYSDILTLDDIENLDTKSLKKCVNSQRVAWKYLSNDENVSQTYKARTVYLSRLLDSSDKDTHVAIIDLMKSKDDGILQQLWKIEQNDLLQKIVQLSTLSQQGGDLPPRLVNLTIDSFNQINKSKDMPSNSADEEALSSPSLMMISWLPFIYLSADDPTLQAFFEAMLSNEQLDSALIELVGAIHYQNLFSAVQRNKSLASWFKQIEPSIPVAFKSKAAMLSFRKERESVVVAPYIFEGIPTPEQSSWKATLKAKESAVKSCFPKNYSGPNATFILEQPLNGSSMGRPNKGILRDPIDTKRPQPAFSPEIVSCILDAYSDLPTSPALQTTQTAKIAISFSNN